MDFRKMITEQERRYMGRNFTSQELDVIEEKMRARCEAFCEGCEPETAENLFKERFCEELETVLNELFLDDFEFFSDEHVNRLRSYIEKNFSLDGTSRRLVGNILGYVAAQGDDAEIVLEMLDELLDGVGLTEYEIAWAVKNGGEA